MKVAVVEDEVLIREGIVKLLRRFYPRMEAIYEADSGQAGLDVIRRGQPEIVITDIRMSPMSGLEMLQILLQREKRQFKTIILSAYSEFDYAKQAISLGVSEYLVKPVEVGEFRETVQRVENELREEQMAKAGNPQTLRSLETILRGLLSGQLEMHAELASFLQTTYRLEPDKSLALVAMYFGNRYREESPQVTNKVQAALFHAGYTDQQVLLFPDEHKTACVLYNVQDAKHLERLLQIEVNRDIHRSPNSASVMGFACCKTPSELRAVSQSLGRYLTWNIALGKDVLISYPKIKQVQAGTLHYPAELEKDSVSALYAVNGDALHEAAASLLRYVTLQVYAPEDIVKCIVRYMLSIVQVVKEINYPSYERINEQELLERVNRAVTLAELETILFQLLECAMQTQRQAVGPLVQKAQRIVEEYYRRGITLEEIADRLHVTPDHISTQFTRELGMNFSTYIKQYRINKAKELLLGTDLKLYEIAERVGYSDAKYFSRVFRETVGMLPAEFRKSL